MVSSVRHRMQKGEALDWLDGTWAALWAAARAAYPREACGVLLGTDGTVTGVLPLTNVAEDTSNYEIKIDELLAVYAAEDEGRCELLGYFHSHPRTCSAPSDIDKAYAVPGYAYVVCGVDGATVFRVP